jgi:hypothetical protein
LQQVDSTFCIQEPSLRSPAICRKRAQFVDAAVSIGVQIDGSPLLRGALNASLAAPHLNLTQVVLVNDLLSAPLRRDLRC